MAIQREAIIQKHARLWAREALACEHLFLAFDRSKPTSRMSHLYEKNRGITAGTPDTILITARASPWCEFKVPGNEPTEAQKAIGAKLLSMGKPWFWCTSVDEYRLMLMDYRIPMHQNACFLAMHHDGLVRSEIAKAELKAGVAPKRARKPRAMTSTAKLAAYRKMGIPV